ncbi:glycosyltransferase family 2 protein [Vibrio splendidus]
MKRSVKGDVVSVCVLSYNSEDTILETLNSFLDQGEFTSQIEIIIGDDCSSDNSYNLAVTWKSEFESKFKRIKIIKNPENKGVSSSFKNLIDASTGKWIKVIAADDLLSPNAIESYLFYAEKYNAQIVFGLMECFTSNGDCDLVKPSIRNRYFFELESQGQYKYLLNNSFNIAPSSFILRDVLYENNLPHLNYRNFEDLPTWLTLTSIGKKMHLLEKITVKYRVGDSLSNNQERIVNPSFHADLKNLYINEIWPNQSIFNLIKYESKLRFICLDLFVFVFNNKSNWFTLVISRFGMYLKPSNTSLFLRKCFYRKSKL